MDTAINWINKAYGVILGFAVIWGGWYFAKSQKLKKADEDSAAVSVAKEMMEVINLSTQGFKDELIHVRAEFKELQKSYIELSIQVGVFKADNERKDKIIEEQRNEIKLLKDRILQLEV